MFEATLGLVVHGAMQYKHVESWMNHQTMLVTTFPLQLLSWLECQNGPLSPNLPRQPHLDWEQPAVKRAYSNMLASFLNCIPHIDVSALSTDIAEASVNSLSDAITSANIKFIVSPSLPMTARTHRLLLVPVVVTARWSQNWSTATCIYRDRIRLFYHILNSSGRPGEGITHQCYKDARRIYRRTLSTSRHGKFWNLDSKARACNISSDAILVSALHTYYDAKFNPSEPTSNPCISDMETAVHTKQDSLHNEVMNDNPLSEIRMKSLVRRLKEGCFPSWHRWWWPSASVLAVSLIPYALVNWLQFWRCPS